MKGKDLRGRILRVVQEFRAVNPRRPYTHGWLAFEVLRLAPQGELPFEEYERRLFAPSQEIRELARQIRGQVDAYQDLKHIRCDLFRRTVVADPPLDRAWYDTQRCSPGSRDIRPVPLLEVETIGEWRGPELTEGAVTRVVVNAYERNPQARAACIQHYGTKCAVCQFSFETVYGSIGEGFIHVHHIIPVSSQMGSKYVVDPIRDLRPVCPNCHAMLHRVEPPLAIDDLRGRLAV